MYTLEYTSQFKKDMKDIVPQKMEKIHTAFKILEETGTLPYEEYKTHRLIGDYIHYLEAHIESDLLLIWIDKEKNVIRLSRIGSHSKLFGKKNKRK
ncbi:MAG: type II toxin-antitoxin system YafQ family toxin [Bacteroidales bacterium]|nr:type II toxin-antitoxin system YafQ family toxin [Bacteroidales bacterium]